MKVLIFIEHDIVIRHFVLSGVFDELSRLHQVYFVFPEPGNKRVKTDVDKLELLADIIHLPVHKERRAIWVDLFKISKLSWRPGKHHRTIRKIHRLATNGFKREWSKATVKLTLKALPGVSSFYRSRLLDRLKKVPNEALDALLKTYRPDVVIHPCVLSGSYIDDLTLASKEFDIPLILIMNSWDNPATKHSAFGLPDWLLVWGEQTEHHAVQYMSMPTEKIVKFGAAQFEVYRSPPRITRQEFCYQHHIDPDSKILLYAGSSKGSDEFSHLLEIENAIASGYFKNLKVIYRPHPWGNGGKEGSRILEYSWQHIRIESSMLDYLRQVKDGNPGIYLADYRHTHDVLSSVDALVSPLSTILLEGAMHGKPVMCFLPDEETHSTHYDLARGLIHFEDMFTAPEVIVGYGQSQFLPKLEVLLSKIGDSEFELHLIQMANYFVEPFKQPYDKRLIDFVEAIVDDSTLLV